MFLRQFLPKNRKAEANQSSRVDDRPSAYTSNVTMVPSHNLSGRDSLREPDETQSSLRLTDTLGLAETSELEVTPSPNYIYYRIYAENGAIPSKTPVDPGDPFLGRIKARSVPPPRNVKAVKCRIAKVENIKDRESTNLFLTPYSESPMDDAEKITILNGTGPGSTPQEHLALVAKMSDSERSALESDGRGVLASAADSDSATPPEIQYVYYLLYADSDEIPSKVSFDPEEPSLGRIRADSIAPPHSTTSFKRCISRVEKNPALSRANLFADTSCDTPLEEGQISLLRSDGPGLSPSEPMAIVQVEESPDPLPVTSSGRYVIKNRTANIYWYAAGHPNMVFFWHTEKKLEMLKDSSLLQWDITYNINGNISITPAYDPSSYSWVGADFAGSTAPVPWRLIPAHSKSSSYYLTTDMNRVSRNPRVPAAQQYKEGALWPGTMATLKEGDQSQMWEFIRMP